MKTKTEATKHTQTVCTVGPQFGPHGGRQMRSRRYFVCGCDDGKCENHGRNMFMGPKWEIGEPKKCAKCQAKAESK